jgi:hypothetical protein
VDNPAAPPWERFPACATYGTSTPRGLEVLAWVTAFIAQNLIARKGRWFLDQIALFLAHRAKGTGLRLETWNAATGPFSVQHHDDSVVWTVAIRKNEDGPYRDYKKELIQKYDLYHNTAL